VQEYRGYDTTMHLVLGSHSSKLEYLNEPTQSCVILAVDFTRYQHTTWEGFKRMKEIPICG
ncbi:hypothetical protein KI387_012905, partial [Taxus chinensis]